MQIMPRLRRFSAMTAAVLRDPRRRGVKLTLCDPCYWIIDCLSDRSVALDFGLGDDADFSQSLIARYGLTSYGFDPTRRHQAGLRKVAEESKGRFLPNELAIGTQRGTCTFYESQENISGSTLANHPNVTRDTVRSYDVNMITVADAIDMAPGGRVDLIKMDIEGLEFDVLEGLPDDVIRRVGQWIVEFHHDSPGFDFPRTRRMVNRFRALGFRSYTRDNVNFLFYHH